MVTIFHSKLSTHHRNRQLSIELGYVLNRRTSMYSRVHWSTIDHKCTRHGQKPKSGERRKHVRNTS